MTAAVVDYQIDDLLFRKANANARIRERHVIAGLRRVRQILPLPLPSEREIRYRCHATIENVSGNDGVWIEEDVRLRGIFPCMREKEPFFATWDAVVVQVLH
jgi:hypothetical protein